MDELIDIVDQKGNYIGKTCWKSEAHKYGYYHNTAHVWLYTLDKKILLQKRALTKKVYPGIWDISVAGHVSAGEKIKIAAIREAKEEIDFIIKPEKLHKIYVRRHQFRHKNGIIDNEFHHVFISELTDSIDNLRIQKLEVDEVKLFDLAILNKTNKHKDILLPEYQNYYSFVYNKIKDILT